MNGRRAIVGITFGGALIGIFGLLPSGLPLSVLLPSIGAAFAHDTGSGLWIAAGGYRDLKGTMKCCNDRDCSELSADDVTERAGTYFIRSLRETVPPDEVQLSEDGLFWHCRKGDGSRRCFFAPPKVN